MTTFEIFAITKTNKEVEIYMGTNEKVAFQTFDFYRQNKKEFNLQTVVINNDDIENKVYIEA